MWIMTKNLASKKNKWSTRIVGCSSMESLKLKWGLSWQQMKMWAYWL